MERPKGQKLSVEREVTPEIMYIQDRWQNGQPVGYFNELPDLARRMYERDATLLASLGGQPTVMGLYEHYDASRSALSRSCEALVEELFTFKDDYSTNLHQIFEIPLPPYEVMTKLRALPAGALLARDDEQLVMPSRETEGEALDVRKADATLTDTSLRVWKYTADRKYAITAASGTAPQYPRDFLAYPADEATYQYAVEVSFDFYHPTANIINETVGLYINGSGDLSVARKIFIPGHSEESSEGAYDKLFSNASEQDIAAFADFIAEIVGEVPTPAGLGENYDLQIYINGVPNGLTRAYLTEYLDNLSAPYLRRCLSTRTANGVALRDALLDRDNADAHEMLRVLVNDSREFHNARYTPDMLENDNSTQLWRDRIERTA